MNGSETGVPGFEDDFPNAADDHAGDYSVRLEEILDDDARPMNGTDDNDDDEGFVYQGVDAAPVPSRGAYRSQLRNILGADHEDDELEEQEAEKPLHVPEDGTMPLTDGTSSDVPPSTPSASHSATASPLPVTPVMLNDSFLPATPEGVPSKLVRPYLHPTVSRLRAYPVRPPASPGAGNGQSDLSIVRPPLSPAPSHFSMLSADSPVLDSQNRSPALEDDHDAPNEREVFKWTRLRDIEDIIFSREGLKKRPAPLVDANVGTPTVLAADKFICVGTDAGRILVFDFKQTLRCICGTETLGKTAGAITAIALSHDHTFVASGHATGWLLLYDLARPNEPARRVAPTSLANVQTGRTEGHLPGARIVAVGFVGARHTALVSADVRGLAFYHALGKVAFVEARDTLRILGRYPDASADGGPVAGVDAGFPPTARRRGTAQTGILALAPLPLSNAEHPTPMDAFQVSAVLTPAKLVVVGLKPSPKTWYRRHRPSGADGSARGRAQGCMAWHWVHAPAKAASGDTKAAATKANAPVLAPVLIHSWADTLYLLRPSRKTLTQPMRNARTGKIVEMVEEALDFEEGGSWRASGSILGLHWLNANQVIVLTPFTLEVYDVRTMQLIEHSKFNAASLATPRLAHNTSSAFHYSGNVGDVAHSLGVYKGKIFLLAQTQVQVGAMLTWADRILHFVEDGDFLGAIELARSYYTGDAPGNRNGLPDEPDALHRVVGEKLHELMVASARYAFSEDRLTDASHSAGVDRTAMFEDLVRTCARACTALDNLDFLFEDLFQYYEDWAIPPIFLRQLEHFVAEGTIRTMPPRVSQRLLSMLEEEAEPRRLENVIWHIDPACVDVDQAIRLCRMHELYDALVFLYTSAMGDYVAPLVELLGMLRIVQRYRVAIAQGHPTSFNDDSIEPIVLNGYKIFAYLAALLSGRSYPAEEPMSEEDADRAKHDIYELVFSGRSKTWPSGPSGQLILTTDIEGGAEPTYPYLRLLLRFDTESFLHSLDIAFEDAYLNDEPDGIGRFVIVKILQDVIGAPDISPGDVTLVNIFLARNIPKYPQYITALVAPSTYEKLLADLAQDADSDTREDRQLAAEYLLSAHSPHHIRELLRLFQQAGFYRILRRYYRQEQEWSPLLQTFVHDADMSPEEVFSGMDETLQQAQRTSKGVLPSELLNTMSDAIPRLLETDVRRTAVLLDGQAPALHDHAVNSPAMRSDLSRLTYLRCLLDGPSLDQTLIVDEIRATTTPSPRVSQSLRQLFVELRCQYDPASVRRTLKVLSEGPMDWNHVVAECERHGVFDAAVWATAHIRGPEAALRKADALSTELTNRIVAAIATEADESVTARTTALRTVLQEGLEQCQAALDIADAAAGEELWALLLTSEINAVQHIGAACSDRGLARESRPVAALGTLRTLFHDTFGALTARGSAGVSAGRLFRRLLDGAPGARAARGAAYAEFRAVLSGLLGAYGAEREMLVLAKHLVERDTFDALDARLAERSRGFAPARPVCGTCRRSVLVRDDKSADTSSSKQSKIVVGRAGTLFHATCMEVSAS